MLVSLNKVHAMIRILLLLLCVHLIASYDPPPSSRKRPVHDPVSNFFSELGDLFLDIDQTLAVQTAPKVEREDNLVTQILKPTSEYFDRIQKNYRNMQKRLGRLIGSTIGHKSEYSDHELSTVGPPHVLAEKLVSTTSAPETVTHSYNPFVTQDRERERFSSAFIKTFFGRQGDTSDSAIPAEEVYSESFDVVDECSNEILSDPVLEYIRQEKCNRAAGEQAKKVVKEATLDPKSASQILFPLQSKELDNLSKGILGRTGDFVSAERPENGRHTLDECSNEILSDPVLELVRQERCHNVKQAAKDVASMLNRKQANPIPFLAKDKELKAFSKEFLKRLGYGLSEESLIALEDECLNEIATDPVLESLNKDRCALIQAEILLRQKVKKASQDPELAREILVPLFKASLPKDFHKRQGDSIDSEPTELQNGVSSDSESFFEKRARQILTDHSRWLLNNPLLNRWRLSSTESSTDAVTDSTTENVPEDSNEVPIPTSEYKVIISKSGESPAESHYYKVVNEDGEMEEVDIVLKSRVNVDEAEEKELKDAVILAFTSDGVPLKLRMGPEMENPLGYLHKALKSAGVSLNIPVESFDDLEPVGKEVLKLGSGLLSRSVYINVSKPSELKTLLKSLMKLKASGK